MTQPSFRTLQAGNPLPVKIGDSEKVKKQPPVITCPSTQPQASGTVQVSSRGAVLPPKSGRTTRTALKAAKPLTPRNSPTHSGPVQLLSVPPHSEQLQVPPTHPIQLLENIHPCRSQTLPLAIQGIPTISQLRDYPNLSHPPPPTTVEDYTPLGPAQSSVIVTLPNSAPSSPTPFSYLDIETVGDAFVTPSTSPQVSVIHSNPSYLPPPTFLQPKHSTPTARAPTTGTSAGTWDNYQEETSYQSSSRKFWETRKKIPVVSTDISELGSEVEGPSPFNLNAAVVDVSQVFLFDQNLEMPNQDEENMSSKEEAESRLRDLDVKVRDMCEDLPADMITELSAPLMQGELDKIAVVRDEYRKEVRAFLSQFTNELVSTEKSAWEADLTSLLNIVKTHKFRVLEKVSSFTQQATPMTEFERESIELKKKKLNLRMEALEGKKNEALAVAQPLKQLITTKCTELDEELEQITSARILEGDDQLVIKTMQKLAGWKASMESIRVTYQEFQTTTALYNHRMSILP